MTHSSKASVKKHWRALLTVSVVPFGRPPLLDVSCVVVVVGEVNSELALFLGEKTGSIATGSVAASAANDLQFAAETGDRT
jgi:molybdopterin-binding protein